MARPSEDDLLELSYLMDSLKSDDFMVRLRATHYLPTIAEAIGPERTRKELVPFLLGLF